MSEIPIGPYWREDAAVRDWDPRAVEVAARVAELVRAIRPDLGVEHIGSTAVPGLPGKGIVDLAVEVSVAELPTIVEALLGLGFQRQGGVDPWPDTRPMLVGSLRLDDARSRLHLHLMPRDHRQWAGDFGRHVGFRDALRADPALRDAYAAVKRGVVREGIVGPYPYTVAKGEWVAEQVRRLGLAQPPILPPATIGILGGGQLGRMLGFAARALGYRVAVLDPDPECPAAAVADRVVVASYADVDAALELAAGCDVATYELEHVEAEVVRAVEREIPVRPGYYPLTVTQDRLAERGFLADLDVPVAPWREVRDLAGLRAAAGALGFPGAALRLKATIGGYDGRSQVRIAAPDGLEGAIERLGRPAGEPMLLERELDFACELSQVIARGLDGREAAFPVARNVHDAGILIESVAPAPVPSAVAEAARSLAGRLATSMGLVGLLTVELFLLPDGSLAVNELAPRVHNSGHWTLEACRTSQFEQHVRAICGLPLGSPEPHTPAALVNLLGEGPGRPARLTGLDAALADPLVHVHLYDKRRVFERRKMGHVTATGMTVEEALERARTARARLGWTEAT